MRFPRKRGSTSVMIRIFIPDNSVSNGAGCAGLTSASTNLAVAYSRELQNGFTQITGANLVTITTIGTWASPGTGKLGFKAVDATNYPGLYEIHFPDDAAAFGAADTSQHITINILELTTSALKIGPCGVLIPLVPWDYQDGVRMGLTALPNAAAEAAGGLYTRGTGAGQINQDAAGRIDVNLVTIKTQAITCGAAVTVLASVGTAATNTAQTGDNYARLGAPTGASISDDVAAVKAVDDAVKAKTDFLPSATAGSAGGLFISGANAETTIAGLSTGALNCTSVACVSITVAGAVEFQATFAVFGNFIVGGSITGNITGNLSGSVGSVASGGIVADSFAAGAINAAAIATDAIDSDAIAASAVTEIQAGLSTYAGADTAGTTTLLARLTAIRSGYLDNISAGAVALEATSLAIKAKTDNLPGDPADASDVASAFSTVNGTLAAIAGYIDTEVGAIKAKTDNLPAAPASTGDCITAAGVRSAVGLGSANLDTQLSAIDDFLNTEISAIKAKTDQLVFTVANQVDANALTGGGGGGLDAAGVRAAVGLGAANLDTQLADIGADVGAVPGANAIADAVLTRDWTATVIAVGQPPRRSLMSGARKLVNHIDTTTLSGSLSVMREDDITVAYQQVLVVSASAELITSAG